MKTLKHCRALRYRRGPQFNRHYAEIGQCLYTQRNLFEILLNPTEIRLYLPFSSIYLEQQTDCIHLLFQIKRKMINTI